MTTKTYGTLQLGYRNGERAWQVTAEPHVAIFYKRVLTRAYQGHAGIICVDFTPDVARDLEWMMERYPLTMTEKARTTLVAEADKDRHREETMLAILDGTHERAMVRGWQEPAREARPYQTVGADLAYVQGGMILADDLGLGKTQTGAMLFRDPATLPALFVTLTHLPRQMEREIKAIFPNLATHVLKGTKPYPVDADVIITSYSKLHGWRDYLSGRIKAVVFDEVQELRKDGTNKYDAAKHIADKADWRLGMSATPVYNYGGETHVIYEVLSPGSLGSRSEFMREWGGSDYGNQNIALREAKALGSFLRDRGLLLRRTRSEVGREIPEPIRVRQEVPASDSVMDSVKGDLLAMADLLETTEGRDRWRMAGDLDYMLRHATGVAKARGVAEYVRLLLESEPKVLLYGWHHDVYDIWQHHLGEHGVVRYTGQESDAQKQRARDAFCDPNGPARVLMMSLRSGAGLDGLQYSGCKAVVFGELDWSPQIHEQAIGRVARDGQPNEVLGVFCVTDSGSDPVIAQRLAIKAQQGEQIRNPDADDTQFAKTLGSVDKGKLSDLIAAAKRL